MTLILALDIATTTGFAYGRAEDSKPRCGSIRFGKYNSDDNEIFAEALDWALSFFTAVAHGNCMALIEQMLPPIVRATRFVAGLHGAIPTKTGATTGAVHTRLAGLQGIMRGVLVRTKVPRIETVAVGDVRAHFIGDRKAKRVVAKRETVKMCRLQGWDVKDDNQADACALWSYGCALIDPRSALRLSPLFNRVIAP